MEQQLRFYHLFKYTFIILLFNTFCYSQEKITYDRIDSLSYLDYDAINKLINFKDTLKAEVLVNAYLKKGKREQDSFRQARAYRILFILNKEKNENTYADSIINISKNLNHKDFPAIGYFFKGVKLYGKGDYMSALDYFLKAKNHFPVDQPDVERYIGIFKNETRTLRRGANCI